MRHRVQVTGPRPGARAAQPGLPFPGYPGVFPGSGALRVAALSLGGERTEVLPLSVEIRKVYVTEEAAELGLKECDSKRDCFGGWSREGTLQYRVQMSQLVLGAEAVWCV